MACLAVVPGNTLADLVDKGLGQRLSAYYDPRAFFDKVFFLSPFESRAREAFGMHIIPCKDIQLPLKLKEYKADLVRAYGGGTPARMAVFHRAKGIPVIVSIHDKRPEKISPAVRFADVVFVVSEELRQILTESYGVAATRIFVVPNGVDAGLMRPLGKDETGGLLTRFPFRKKLLHVGRKSPEKNVEAVIRALVSLGPDYGLVAVGQGDAAAYQALAKELGVANRCVFLAGVPQAELVKFYNWADCVCHPSRSEAMCNVLLEALACGCAVVATETAARGLGSRPMKAMLLVRDPDDGAALEAQIRRACADGDVRYGLLAGARQGVEEFFLERTQVLEAAAYQAVLEMNVRGEFRRNMADDAVLWAMGAGRRLMRTIGGHR